MPFPPEAPDGVSGLGEAYRACLAAARSHYENFPVASRLVPRALRGPLAAIYAFARAADDFADEPGADASLRQERLADWRRRLNDLSRHDNHPVFWALGDTISRFGLPLDPFSRLLTAFEMDVDKTRYERFEDLLFYCRHSANPVGELVLRLFGQWSEPRGILSDFICTGLQLANFWQDVALDAHIGRLYLPLEDLRRFGVSEEEALAKGSSEAKRRLMAFEVGRTEEIFRRGRALCDGVRGRLRFELRLVWLGGNAVLRKIRSQEFDPWSQRPKLSKTDWLFILPRLLSWSFAGGK